MQKNRINSFNLKKINFFNYNVSSSLSPLLIKKFLFFPILLEKSNFQFNESLNYTLFSLTYQKKFFLAYFFEKQNLFYYFFKRFYLFFFLLKLKKKFFKEKFFLMIYQFLFLYLKSNFLITMKSKNTNFFFSIFFFTKLIFHKKIFFSKSIKRQRFEMIFFDKIKLFNFFSFSFYFFQFNNKINNLIMKTLKKKIFSFFFFFFNLSQKQRSKRIFFKNADISYKIYHSKRNNPKLALKKTKFRRKFLNLLDEFSIHKLLTLKINVLYEKRYFKNSFFLYLKKISFKIKNQFLKNKISFYFFSFFENFFYKQKTKSLISFFKFLKIKALIVNYLTSFYGFFSIFASFSFFSLKLFFKNYFSIFLSESNFSFKNKDFKFLLDLNNFFFSRNNIRKINNNFLSSLMPVKIYKSFLKKLYSRSFLINFSSFFFTKYKKKKSRRRKIQLRKLLHVQVFYKVIQKSRQFKNLFSLIYNSYEFYHKNFRKDIKYREMFSQYCLNIAIERKKFFFDSKILSNSLLIRKINYFFSFFKKRKKIIYFVLHYFFFSLQYRKLNFLDNLYCFNKIKKYIFLSLTHILIFIFNLFSFLFSKKLFYIHNLTINQQFFYLFYKVNNKVVAPFVNEKLISFYLDLFTKKTSSIKTFKSYNFFLKKNYYLIHSFLASYNYVIGIYFIIEFIILIYFML